MWFGVIVKFFKGMFLGGYRDVLPWILGILLIAGIGWKINSTINDYKDEISKLEGSIVELKQTIQDEKDKHNDTLKELAESKLEVAIKDTEILKLQVGIDKQNASIQALAANENQLKEEIEKWKHQPPKEVIKYVEKKLNAKDLKKITLEACKKVNMSINNLDYREIK